MFALLVLLEVVRNLTSHAMVDAVLQKPWLSWMLRSFCDTPRLMI